MKISIIFLISLIVTLFIEHNLSAQIIDKTTLEKLKNADRSEFRYIPKKSGHYTPEDWRSAIDSTWGQGMSAAQKLQLFDYCWNLIDDEYPSFFNIDDQWNSLYSAYYDTIYAGVSRGRFSAIMNHMFSRLIDLHLSCTDIPVSMDTLKSGIPIFVPTGVISALWSITTGNNFCHFGASLAPLPDSTVFVYDVAQNHPLGLELGDIILGYDNIPWKLLYKELIAAELPIAGLGNLGTNSNSVTHGLLTAAGENWHLFDVIDILKYSTGDTIHLPTSLLINQQMQLLTTDQLPVPGVPFPDVDNGHFVSWGIVSGTQTGYIYVWTWTKNGFHPYPTFNAGDDFLQALQILINDYHIDGLIIDSRFNLGGAMTEYTQCLSILFNKDQDTYQEYRRNDPNNHYSMQRIYENDFKVYANNYLFDKPIAMLTGPFSVSCGDMMPLQMREHPMVRTFGLGTNGAFGIVWLQDISHLSNNWIMRKTYSNLTHTNNPNLFLTHLNIPPDEEIWFTQADAVNHDDTVVRRALQWIDDMIYAHNVKPGSYFYQSNQDTITITANVANPDNHNLNVSAIINTLDSIFVDSVLMFDDGNHGDSLAGDGLYGTYVNPLMSEDIFTISASTTDLDSTHYHILPRATRFTTIGPVVFVDYNITSSDTIPNHGDYLNFVLTLQNNGQLATAKNISAELSAIDTCAVVRRTRTYGDILAGSSVNSYGYYAIRFLFNCPDSINVPFKLDIASDGYVFWSDTFSVFVHKDTTTGIDTKDNNIQKEFALNQNYPNPFNPTTNIEFSIPKTEFVTLKIYNLLGQKVATLVSDILSTGSYSYEWEASQLASGVYLYRLETEGYVKMKKMIIMK